MAQRREQFLEEGMPQEQLENVLAEFSEQQIKAAKNTKAANSMAKKQGSVGEDEEAVAIAGLAAAEEAGEVAAGSAVAGEAEQDVVRSEDAPALEDDGFGPPPQEPKAEPLHHRSPKRSLFTQEDAHLKIIHRCGAATPGASRHVLAGSAQPSSEEY